jgi:hypothetical protein
MAEEYLPQVSWETNIYDVVLIAEATDEIPAQWRVTVSPEDQNDIGSNLDIEIDNYLVDNAGHIFRIIDNEYNSVPFNILVSDDFRCDLCPQPDLTGYVCKSSGNGVSPHITPAMLERLDKRARDYVINIEKDILWKYPKDINVKWHPDGVVFSADPDNQKSIEYTTGQLFVHLWPSQLESEYRVNNVTGRANYHPEKIFDVTGNTSLLPDDDLHYIFAKVPLSEVETTAEIIITKVYRYEDYYDGYLNILMGIYNIPDAEGKRDFAMLWGNEHDERHLPVTIDPESVGLAEIGADQVLTIIKNPEFKDGLISGGIVSWIEGFDHLVSTAIYRYLGIIHTIASDTVTLANADLVYPRIDVVALNVAGYFEVLTGAAAENPVKPQVDTLTQIELTNILILANATAPDGITDELIYDENTEWTTSVSGVIVDFDSVVDPFHGAKCASVGAISNYDTITFSKPSGVITVGDFENLIININLSAVMSNSQMFVFQLMLDAVTVSPPQIISLDKSSLVWQNINILLEGIVSSGNTFNKIRFQWIGVDNVGFYLDYVKLQKGIVTPVFIDTVELTGDVTGKGKTGTPFATTLKTVNSNVGTFGDATKTVTITVDAKGRITAISENDITVTDGREIELSTSGGYIVWRYVGDVSWTNLCLIPADGDDGVSTYTYVAYASDAAGAGWSLTPTDLLKYRAEIHSATPLTPVEADFVGATWVKYLGDDGAPGGGGSEAPELHLDFEESGDEFIYNVPYDLKFTSQVSEGTAATLSIALNTDMPRYTKLTVTATAAGLVSLYGEFVTL